MKRWSLFLCVLLSLLWSCSLLLERPSLDPYQALFRPDNAPPPTWQTGQVRATFLGTTTLLFEDGKTSILIDGFLTRPGPSWTLPFTRIETNRDRVRKYLRRLNISQLAAVFVFHSHYDHALDAPYIALQPGADIVGSASTAMIARGEGLGTDRIVSVKPYQTVAYGKFKVTMIPSQHIDLPWPANLTGMMGTITAPLSQPASMFDYREGGTYTIHIEHPQGKFMLHSGGFRPGELNGYRVDTLFLSLPGLSALGDQQAAFHQEVIAETGVKTIYPVHWDDFSISLDQPLQPLPRSAVNFDADFDFIRASVRKIPGLEIRFLRAWEQIVF